MSLFRITILALLFSTPLYGQAFEELVDELSDTEDEEVESEEATPQPAKIEEKPTTPPPTSTEIQAKAEDEDFIPEKNIVTNGVTLQGLDKQTARVFIIDAKIGQPIEFGPLTIIIEHCEKAPLAYRQESMAYVKITENKPNQPGNVLFSGWMFSSSPALSALDHPIYDVWIKGCKAID